MVGLGGAGDAAGDALEADAVGAAGQADLLGDARDGAHGGVFALVARDEQDLLGVADVDRKGHVHGGEDDGVVERDEEQLRHARQPLGRSTVALRMTLAQA